MFKRKIILFVIACLPGAFLSAQSANSISISKVNIVDPDIETHVRIYLDSIQAASDFWKSGKGYLRMTLREPKTATTNRNPVIRYYELRPSITDFDSKDDSVFPLFYTHMAGKVVLIEYSGIDPENFLQYRLKAKSKKRFRRLIEPFLPEVKKRTEEDLIPGQKRGSRYYREIPFIYTHTLHLEVSVYADGTSSARQVYTYD